MADSAPRVRYRVTVRYSAGPRRYAVFELDAASLADALGRAAERIPEEARASADLIEVRRANPAEEGPAAP